MARKKQRGPVYLVKEPNWAKFSLETDEDKRYEHFKGSEYFLHSEISDKVLYESVIRWVNEASGWDKETIKLVLAAPAWCWASINKYCFFWEKVGYMPQKMIDYLENKLDYLKERGQKELDEKAERIAAPKRKIVRINLDLFLNAVEDIFDWLANGRKAQDAVNLVKQCDLNKEEVASAVVELQTTLDELLELQRVRKIVNRSDWDEQLVEGYSWINRPNTQKIVDWYKEAVTELGTAQERKKVVRRKKPQDPRKIVARLRHLQADKDLNIASIQAVDILGASECWVYDTKRKRLGLYMSKGVGGLGVKGTSITGYDEDLSYEKTLRKPEEQLKNVMSKSKKAIHEVVGKIRGKKMKPKTRINPNMLLLKVQ